MKKNMSLPGPNTTLAELLDMGAKIGFLSGRTLRGVLGDRYIEVGNEFGSLGVWDMDAKSGIDEAVEDLVRDAREQGLGLHGDELAHEDDETQDDEDAIDEDELHAE